jgi:hypothetical protein
VKSRLTRDFLASFAALPERIQRLARENYILWKRNPHHPSLSFKRVGHKYPAYSVRIGLGWRAVGFLEADGVVWFWVGSHADYERIVRTL